MNDESHYGNNNNNTPKETKIFPKKYNQLGSYKYLKNGEIPCSRHIWYVNFQDLGWDNFIIAPKGYMAYRCKGSCKATDNTHHGEIKKIYQGLGELLESPRCVPTSYKYLPLMYFDNYENIVVKQYDEMIVEKCGCR